jgi:hypothetical protein
MRYNMNFDFEHANLPAPFNKRYDPKAGERYKLVSESMEDDGFYDSHTREECRVEWGKRYDILAGK